MSIVLKVRQRIFSRSDQINNDTAEEEEDAVFPSAAAIANAVYSATAPRLRILPLTLK
jgi:hypothetical protein